MPIDFYRNWHYSHGAFFKQCPKFNIIFVETFDGTKGMVFYKGGNIKPRVMKGL
jgi:hypothetical protein